jgi:hypothetical protein
MGIKVNLLSFCWKGQAISVLCFPEEHLCQILFSVRQCIYHEDLLFKPCCYLFIENITGFFECLECIDIKNLVSVYHAAKHKKKKDTWQCLSSINLNLIVEVAGWRLLRN